MVLQSNNYYTKISLKIDRIGKISDLCTFSCLTNTYFGVITIVILRPSIFASLSSLACSSIVSRTCVMIS